MSPLIDPPSTHNPLQWHLSSVCGVENGGARDKLLQQFIFICRFLDPSLLARACERERERERCVSFALLFLRLLYLEITKTVPDLTTVYRQRGREHISPSLPFHPITRRGLHVSSLRHSRARVCNYSIDAGEISNIYVTIVIFPLLRAANFEFLLSF